MLVVIGIFLAFVVLAALRNYSVALPFPRWLPSAVILGLAFLGSALTVVPAGHVGVQVLFGKVYPDVLPEGLHIVNPMISVKNMSVRTQEIFEPAESPSREGLNVVLEASLLYHVNPETAARLYQQVGPQYAQVVLAPSFRSAIRGVTVQHEAKDLYTSGREIIATQIAEDLKKTMAARGLSLEQVLLRRIQLPKMVEDAINDKLAAEQQAQRMQFVLAKETQEAERKRIEAKGIQDFQNIVSQGLSENLLRWKGIEATRSLAESPNAKVIVVGGRDGLPLILNTETRSR
ncbi:MAG: prohibitin family protein [Deltaproteobacteria bacterium]|nr:prohibitin family protein [Deltaproteobacteria bacterium]